MVRLGGVISPCGGCFFSINTALLGGLYSKICGSRDSVVMGFRLWRDSGGEGVVEVVLN